MRVMKFVVAVAVATSGILGVNSTAVAAEVLCKSIANNHMFIDSTYVSSCIDAGVGNIGQGNQNNDDFLNGLPLSGGLRGGYTSLGTPASLTYTNVDPLGAFSFASSLWNSADELFIGFKFGTGNTADEWMVYQLNANVSSGTWRFVDVLAPGNSVNARISHIAMYSKGDGDDGGGGQNEIPEPGSLALVGLALLGAFGARRRKL